MRPRTTRLALKAIIVAAVAIAALMVIDAREGGRWAVLLTSVSATLLAAALIFLAVPGRDPYLRVEWENPEQRRTIIYGEHHD